jgi:hypothetical protein
MFAHYEYILLFLKNAIGSIVGAGLARIVDRVNTSISKPAQPGGKRIDSALARIVVISNPFN